MYQVSLSGQSGNSAMVSIGTNISSDNLSVTNASVVNMTVSNLKTTIFSPNVFNTSVLNASALTLSGTMLLLNVSKLNVCNLSCLHISATSITAANVQPTLTAGTNVTIVNNVISASNAALIPSALNVSSITVTGSTIIGGETIISDSLLVTDTLQAGDFVCNGTITGTNLSTTALSFGNALAYASSTKTLSVQTTGLVTQNSTTPITSGAVYSAINQSSSQLHNVQHYRGVTGTSEESVTPVDYIIDAGITGDVFFLNYYPKFQNSYITVQMCFAYTFGIAGADTLYGRIVVGIQDNTTDVTIQDQRQQWNSTAGGGTRSGDIGMLQGTYKNTTTAGQFDRIKLEIVNESASDSFSLLYPNYISVMVTETLNLIGPAATNVYIGSGNISCNAISCLALSVNPSVRTLATIGYTEFGNASLAADTACMSLKGNATETGYGFAQFTNHTTAMNSMPQSYLSFRHANVEEMVMRNSNFGINISQPTQRLTVVGNASIRGDLKCFGAITATGNVNALKLDSANASIDNLTCQNNANFLLNVSMNGSTFIQNLSVGDLTITGNVYGNTVTAGQNVTVVDNVISAFVEGTAELNISSLHVDKNTNLAGVLNVSKTSTFEKSLNIKETIYGGEAGVKSGQLILYSLEVGNNAVLAADTNAVVIGGTGTIASVDTYLGFEKVFSITTTEVNVSNNVNISGTLTADFINIENLANINACSVNASVGNFSTLPVVNSSTGNFSVLNASQFFTSNMTVSAPDNEPTSFVIHNVCADKTNYALYQNTDGQTNINSSNHLYFRTRGELKMKLDNAGKLGINTLTPDALLHVVGDAHITDSLRTPLVNVSVLNVSSIDADLIVTGNLILNDFDSVTGEVDTLTAIDINTTTLNASQSNMSNLSSTNFSTTRGTITNLSSTNFSTTSGRSTNLSSANFSTTAGTITNLSSTKGTITNLSGTNASFTTLTAGNVQPLLTAGNNIQLVGNTLSTTPNLNVSNLSCINLSATNGAFNVLSASDPGEGLIVYSYQIHTDELYVTDAVTENVTATDKIIIQTALPTLYLRDTDHLAGAIQQNNDLMAFRATSNVGGPLVLTRTMFQLNCSTDDALFYGNVSVTETLQSVGLVSTNASLTNLSGVNGSFTYLTADNLQETLTAGPGISIVDRTISTQQILVAGNNLQIIDETISTTSLLNISNVSSEKGKIVNLSCTNLSATSITANNVQPTLTAGSNLTLVGTLINTSSNLNISNVSAVSGFIYTFEADTIQTIGLNSQGIFSDEADITTVRAIDVDTNSLTCLTGGITNLSSTNISATRSTITNMSSTDFNSTRSTITNMSCSNLSVSNKVSLLNLSGTNATFTSLTAPNVQPTLTAGLNISILNGVVKTNASVNLSYLNSSSGYIYALVTDNIESKAILTEFITSLEGEINALNCDTSIITPFLRATNLSGTNASFISLTAPNVQPTLTAGTGITISGNTISSSASLVAGTNISILNGVIKTTTNLNLSNINVSGGEIDVLNCDVRLTTPEIIATNISGTNASFISLTAPNVQPTLTAGTNISILNGIIKTTTILNASNVSSTNGFIYTFDSDTIGTNGLNTFSLFCDEGEIVNLSGTNASFISLTAPNVQAKLTAGTNITISGNTISSTGGSSLVAGSNISILDGVITTTSTVNVSTLNSSIINAPVIFSNQINSIDGEIDILNAGISVTTPFLAATNMCVVNATFSSSLSSVNLCGTNASFTNLTATNFDATGDSTVGPVLNIGLNDASTTPKTIYFGGLNGDNAYDHTVIESRIYSGSESAELLLFKGNDANQDRIRLRASIIHFDTYSGATTNRTAENIRMTVTGAGNVGIGTTNPTEPLDVIGNILNTGNIQNNKFKVTQVLTRRTNIYPTSAGGQLTIANDVACSGGTLIFYITCSGSVTSGGLYSYIIRYKNGAGVTRATMTLSHYFNQAAVHHAWGITQRFTGIPAANMLVSIERSSGNLRMDSNDFLTIVMEELPY